MKNSKRKSANEQVGTFKLRNHALLTALATAGLISIAQSFAAPMPTVCAGTCGPSGNLNFVQAGKVDAPTLNAAGTAMTINQSTPTAILNWRDFNIAKGYSVEFKQPSVNASALNKIWDANPTNISGSLTSNGQIYLINHNGIVFGNGAQVNTGALIASSLDISDDLFTAGYLTNTKILPAFSGSGGFVKVESGARIKGERVMMFAPVVENSGSIATQSGQVVLAAGNKVYLEASQDPNLRGVLVEVDVTNPGVAESTLLDPVTGKPLIDPVTGRQLIQHIEAGTVTNSADISAERGNVTLVGFAVNQQGRISATTSVTENGSIKLLARYGVQGANQNVTDLGDVINATAQSKGIDGVYDIRATQTGKVTLATDSVTAVTPQEIFDTQQNKWVADTATTTDGQGFKQSIVEVMGNTINMQSGSKIIVPGGKVTLAAISSYVPSVPLIPSIPATATTPAIPEVPEVPASGLIPTAGVIDAYQEVAAPTTVNPGLSTSFINSGYTPKSSATDTARVFLDSGSSIDVSGNDASVSVARNILTVQLRGSQLQDAPVQRTNRALYGKDVQIDLRKGSTLANYSGEEAQVGRTVAERTTAGGSVKLVSTGDVLIKGGSKIDLSGGKINYKGGYIKSTNLISKGVSYDIATASPDIIYDGIAGTYSVTHNKWGVVENFNTLAGGDTRGRWDAGYVEGKSAGSLTVLAPHAVVNGDVIAKTVTGDFQRQLYVDPNTLVKNNYKNTWKMKPQGGSLVIGNSAAVANPEGIINYLTDSNVVLQAGVTSLASDFALFDVNGNVNALLSDNQQNIVLDTTKLFNPANGMNRLAVYSNKTVSVASGTAIELAAGGAITLQGDTVNMLGSIDAPSGTVKLATAVTTASVNREAGTLKIGTTGAANHISTRGQWVNDSAQLGVPDLTQSLLINGGKISLNSGGNLLVAAGTLLDASGGAWLDVANKVKGGDGGAITLASGSGISTAYGAPYKAQLDRLDLRSYGTAGGKGGALTIKAADIVIGGLVNAADTLALPGTFFQEGGFTSYDLTAQGKNGLTVVAGAVIEPKAKSLILDQTASRQASGSDVNTFADVGLLPDWQRTPTSITLTEKSGVLKVEEGAVIRVDPIASITLNASKQLTMLGTLDAPAGKICLNLNSPNNQYAADQSIWLGSNSKLLSQGSFIPAAPNSQNLQRGQVLSGGKINIDTTNGFVVAQQGSLMDVSGTTTNVDLPELVGGNLVYRRTSVDGDAGVISVKTNLGGFLDGEMKAGVAAGSQAAAGKFSLTLNNNPGFVDPQNTGNFPLNPAQIQVKSSGNGSFATIAGLSPGDDSQAGQLSAPLSAFAGKALLDANALKNSGFDQVVLKSENSIDLADGVNLQARRSVTLDAPQMISNGNSDITSAQVTLSNQEGLIGTPVVAGSNGSLNVTGQLVDVTGNVAVSGINQLSLNSSGDIRLNGVSDTTALKGSLITQGDITLQADQIYPTSMSQFKLSVQDDAGNSAGKITVLPGQHAANPVLSAGGQLTLSAKDIVQNGVIKAPLGILNLEGSQSVTLGTGSVTSVSADGLTIPFGLIEGKDWKYDLTGKGALVTIAAPAQKQVKFTAPHIDIQDGATVNLAGGGDLYANEFFAGSGGSVNVLDPTIAAANTFAILPGVSGFSPYDPQLYGQYTQAGSKTTLQSGASVYLSGGNGIKAGYYTLLPASYALLPGAYRITAVAGYTDRQPGQGVTTLVDGTQIMAGKFASIGTGIQDARYSGFAVTSGAVVRTQSEYHDSYSNQFFKDQAATNGSTVSPLAIDAGQLIVSAVGNGATLALNGSLNTLPGKNGRGAMVDLDGSSFKIVETAGDAIHGVVQLTTSSLNNLGAESLLIGGVRTQNTTGLTIAVGASDVVVDNKGSVLTGPEIVLAANSAVTVKAGSDIEGIGTFSGQARDIAIGSTTVKGDGALLRVSSAPQVSVARTNLANTAATLTIEDGATVGAQEALLLDSSNATTVGNKAILNGKSLSVAAQNIDIGTNPTPNNTSLALSGNLLDRALTFKDLTLHSYNDINFYGAGFLGGLDTNQKHILNNLVLNTRSLNGVANKGLTNIIDASNVTLTNNNAGASTSATIGYGEGNLKINAEQIMLADGKKAIQGFDAVTLTAAKQIVGQGTGSVVFTSGESVPTTHKLVLQAGQITATNKSNLTITAKENTITIEPVKGAVVAAGEALNAKLVIEGKSIADNGNISLPSGSMTLHATGAEATDGVTLGDGSKTAATGISKTISGQMVYAQAGSVSLVADNGGVDIQSGALVDVSGATSGGDAGVINITASKGEVSVAGNLKGTAHANDAQGSFNLDAKNLVDTANASTNALTKLNDTLTTGGFTTLRDMRVRTGDLVIDADTTDTVRAKAQTFRLIADDGNIDVNGAVDSSGSNGGNILLAAKNNLTLNTGALLDAHATGAGQKRGKVTLETSVGMIELNNQKIDVQGSDHTGGSVLLRAPRINTNTDVALNNTGGASTNVSPKANVTVEAFQTYAAPVSLTAANAASTTAVYKSDATSFADNNAATIKSRLGMSLADTSQHLTPGVELNSAGDLTLATNWDLSTWRFNDGNGTLSEPGALTLRAGGNLNFGTVVGATTTTASLTDGFTPPPANNVITSAKDAFAPIAPVSGASWSYRLIAGADTTSANVMAVNSKLTGNVMLVAGKEVTGTNATAYNGNNAFTMQQIRTGTGSIDIAAGGNLTLGNRDSVIYTAGQAATDVPITGTNRHFGVNGGDINIKVKGDVVGAETDQLITDWLWRQGTADLVTAQPAWWVNLGSFRQNIGALGGGNVNVSAGGNINNLSAVAPTTGYVDMNSDTHPTVVLGGGNVNVSAGGSVNSGVFYVGNGQGTIRAGADLGVTRKNATQSLATLLALGQGNWDVRAGGDVNLQSIFNPTVLPQGYSQIPSGTASGAKAKNFFFTYADTSSVILSSLSGNVLLSNTIATKSTKAATSGFFYLNVGTQDQYGIAVYPGSLTATAMNGDIVSTGTTTLFPTTKGNLKLIAANDIKLSGGINMSDAASGGMQVNSPTTSVSALVIGLRSQHSSMHAQDTQPVILSAGGNIGNSEAALAGGMVLPKSAEIQAGKNVQNLNFTVQNLNNSDSTSIVAGIDITNVSTTVAGPGQVVLQAGGNVDLALGNGITTKGNLTNLLLPDQGADITVLAGVGQSAATQSFINRYIDPSAPKSFGADLIAYVSDHWSDLRGVVGGQKVSKEMTATQAYAYFAKLPQSLQDAFVGKTYGAELISYVENYGAPKNLTSAKAYKYFIDSLSKSLQDAFVKQVFFNELRETGRIATKSGNYSAGYDAIATLFPTVNDKGSPVAYKGDLNLYYSQIKTERGGNINLLTPGGGINAGLANPPATGNTKTAAQLGIVTVKGGDVNAFVNNDLTVNQSRVFTLQGGNILMWSSNGNIDAGKGSKTVSSTPPPLLVVDPKTGAFDVDVTQSVVGSGIRVLLANKDVVPGTVDLYAPTGEINAGDAGIGAAGNIFLGAPRVVGADNINFGGTSAGVPVAAPAPVSISGMGNMQDASKAADEATQNMANASDLAKIKENLANFKPSFLSVEVVGLGDEEMDKQQ